MQSSTRRSIENVSPVNGNTPANGSMENPSAMPIELKPPSTVTNHRRCLWPSGAGLFALSSFIVFKRFFYATPMDYPPPGTAYPIYPSIHPTGSDHPWVKQLEMGCNDAADKLTNDTLTCTLDRFDVGVLRKHTTRLDKTERMALCMPEIDFLFAVDPDTYPYEGVGASVRRVIRELDKLFGAGWGEILIDPSIESNTLHDEGLPFHRLQEDMTGEIFAGPRTLDLGTSYLIDCRTDKENMSSALNDRDLYLWPPIGGYFPNDWPLRLSPRTTKPQLQKMLQGSINGCSLRGIFDSLRNTIEAWYNDPLVEDKIDVGRYAWPFLRKVLMIEYSDKRRTSMEISEGFSIQEVFPEEQTFPVPRPYFKKLRAYYRGIGERGIVPVGVNWGGRKKAIQKRALEEEHPASGVSFYRNKKYEGKKNIKTYQTEGPSPHSYAVASISSDNQYRIAMQAYLWKKEEIDINFISGINFADQEESDDHFAQRLAGTKWDPLHLLVHCHAKATKDVCEAGADVAVILEDDAFPLKNFKSHLEAQIDALQEIPWGYHSLELQYEFSPQERLLYFGQTHHPASLIDHNISLFHQENGTYAQMINCNRWRWVENKFLLDEKMEYMHPEETLALVREYYQESSKLKFVADAAWMRMFTIDSNDKNTLSLEPLVALSFVEWANPTTLHADIADIATEEAPADMAEAIQSMSEMEFPSTVLDLPDDDKTKGYFWKHMWIPRQNGIYRSLRSWFQIISNAPPEHRTKAFSKMAQQLPPGFIPGCLSVDYVPRMELSPAFNQWLSSKNTWLSRLTRKKRCKYN